jgi:hypothetical protein
MALDTGIHAGMTTFWGGQLDLCIMTSDNQGMLFLGNHLICHPWLNYLLLFKFINFCIRVVPLRQYF